MLAASASELKRRFLHAPRRELAVAVGDGWCFHRPAETERIPMHSGIAGWSMDDIGQVNHGAFVGESQKAVRESRGYENLFEIIRTQFPSVVLAAGGRADSEIENDIQDPAAGAIDQFGMGCRRALKMHPPQHPEVRSGIKLFSGCERKPLLPEHVFMERLDERAAQVSEHLGLKQSESLKSGRDCCYLHEASTVI